MSDTTLSVRVASNVLCTADLVPLTNSAPSRVVEAGSMISKHSPQAGLHRQSLCVYSCPVDGAAQPTEHISWLMGFLSQNKASLSGALSNIEIDVRISFAGQGSFAFEPRELAVLSELNVQLNFDLYQEETGD